MWTCSKCGEDIEDQFDSCWKCQGVSRAVTEPPLRSPIAIPAKRRVSYQYFQSALDSWDTLFQRAADFASRLEPEQLISISHSEDGNDGVVAVWFWSNDVDAK